MPINHEMALQKVSSQKLTAPEDESSWQTVIESKLPDTSSDLSKLLVWSTAKIDSLKNCLQHLDRLDNLGTTYSALQKEARYTAEVIIRIELKLGTLIAQIPKATSYNNVSGKEKTETQNVSDDDLGESNDEKHQKKSDQIKSLGLSQKQAETFQKMAKNKNVVEQAIEEFRDKEKIITRSSVLKKIKSLQVNETHTQYILNEPPKIIKGNIINFQPELKYKLIITVPPTSVAMSANEWLPNLLNNMSDDGCAYIFVDNTPEILNSYLNAKNPDEIIIVKIKSENIDSDKIYKHKHKFCLFYHGATSKLSLSGNNKAIQNVENMSDSAEIFIQQATTKDDIVFDPFASNGDLILTATKLGRKAYGLVQEYFNLTNACENGCEVIAQ